MLTTADPELDHRFRRLRQHAMTIPDSVRHNSSAVVFERYPEVGFNYRMSDLQAAVGRVQLRRLEGLLAERLRQAEIYTTGLQAIPGLMTPQIPPYAHTNYQSYAVRVTPEYPMSRDWLMQYLLDHRISTRRGIMNVHQEPAYADLGPYHLPHSESARDSSLLLPLYPGMTTEESHYVLARLTPPLLR